MRNLFIIAVLAFGMNVTAQTTTNNVLDVRPGTGVNEVKIHNASIEITGVPTNGKPNLWTGTTTTTHLNGDVNVNNGLKMNGSKITGLAAGVENNDAVNVRQLNALNLQVAQDIATAKTQAITSAKTYTDSKIRNINDKIDLNAETAKLYTDKETQRAIESESKINKRIDALELKFDNRINAVMSYVGNEFAAVNNRIEGLGASMVALSAAATSSVYNAKKPTNLNIATGLYGRATAIAVGMSHFFNSSTKVSVNWSQGSNTKNAVGIGCGIAF